MNTQQCLYEYDLNGNTVNYLSVGRLLGPTTEYFWFNGELCDVTSGAGTTDLATADVELNGKLVRLEMFTTMAVMATLRNWMKLSRAESYRYELVVDGVLLDQGLLNVHMGKLDRLDMDFELSDKYLY